MEQFQTGERRCRGRDQEPQTAARQGYGYPRYPLDQIIQAHRHLDGGRTKGKIVLEI